MYLYKYWVLGDICVIILIENVDGRVLLVGIGSVLYFMSLLEFVFKFKIIWLSLILFKYEIL